MTIRSLTLSLLLAASPCFAQIPASSSQLLVVTSADWTELHAQAQRYERHGGRFIKVGRTFAVVLGNGGLGWGRGVGADSLPSGPIKHEGDGKSPAGVFALGTAFGYEPTAPS